MPKLSVPENFNGLVALLLIIALMYYGSHLAYYQGYTAKQTNIFNQAYIIENSALSARVKFKTPNNPEIQARAFLIADGMLSALGGCLKEPNDQERSEALETMAQCLSIASTKILIRHRLREMLEEEFKKPPAGPDTNKILPESCS